MKFKNLNLTLKIVLIGTVALDLVYAGVDLYLRTWIGSKLFWELLGLLALANIPMVLKLESRKPMEVKKEESKPEVSKEEPKPEVVEEKK